MYGSRFLLPFALLLALVALGHDCYLLYLNHEDKGFELSTLGYIWTHYHVDSYKWMVAETAPETWAYIDMVLQYEATLVAAGFTVFVFIMTFILRMTGVITVEKKNASPSSRIDRILGGKDRAPQKFKYKRK